MRVNVRSRLRDVGRLVAACGLTLLAVSCGGAGSNLPEVAPGPLGTIRGHVRLDGVPPDNFPIRMRTDPMCDAANGGRPMFQESVVADADGGLANVFVRLEGSFPAVRPPSDPVLLDQRGCVYRPRVVGVQIGQTLDVTNSDRGLHNVHGQSETMAEFNVSQPNAGMTNRFQPDTEGLLTLRCDVHGWMLAYVHVVSHPYFAVSGAAGEFEIRNVPVGDYTIRAWHEKYGETTTTVQVTEGGVADVAFTYAAGEPAPAPPA